MSVLHHFKRKPPLLPIKEFLKLLEAGVANAPDSASSLRLLTHLGIVNKAISGDTASLQIFNSAEFRTSVGTDLLGFLSDSGLVQVAQKQNTTEQEEGDE